jgi:hypothetical protein
VNLLRVAAILACAVASRRSPAFGAAAVGLGGDELAAFTAEHIPLAWHLAPSVALGSAVAASHGARSRLPFLVFPLPLTWAAIGDTSTHVLTALASYACALTVLLWSRRRRDAGQIAVTLFVSGNIAACTLAMFVGVSAAYTSGVVWASNAVTHIVIIGLAVWTLRAR